MADVSPKDLERVSNFLLKFETQGAENAEKVTAKFSKAIDGLEKSTKSVLGPVQKLAGLVGAGLGFKESAGFIQNYYKSLTSLSAQLSKYNIGAAKMEKEMTRLGSTLRLTKMETIGLMSEFEKGFPIASAQGFEKIMTKIRNTVGSNVDAIKTMASNLGQLAMQYPDLQVSLENLDKLDKERLDRMLNMLQRQEKINLTQVRGIRDYIKQNEQMTKGDKARLKELKSFQDSMQDVKSAFEDISMVVGESLVPMIKSVASYMKENKEYVLGWVKYLMQAAKVLIPIIVGVKAISGISSGIKTLGGAFGGKGAGDCEQSKKCAGVASKQFWSMGTLRAAGKIMGIGVASYAGVKMGQTIGGIIGKMVGDRGAGEAVGGVAGGAIAGGMVGGLPGAAVGAAIGALSFAHEQITAASRLAEANIRKINETTKRNIAKINEAVEGGDITKERGDIQKKIELANEFKRAEINLRYANKEMLKTVELAKEAAFWTANPTVYKYLKQSAKNLEYTIKGQTESITKYEEEIKLLVKSHDVQKKQANVENAAKKTEDERRNAENIRYKIEKGAAAAAISVLEKRLQLKMLEGNVTANSLDSEIKATEKALSIELKTTKSRMAEAKIDLEGSKTSEDRLRLTEEIRNYEDNILRIELKRRVLWKENSKALEINKQLLAGTSSIMETQIGILDQMGMGIGAPAEMRYQLMQQVGKQILEVDKQLAIARKEQAEGNRNQADVQKEINAKELERLQLIQKQFSVSKALREGWVSALGAMTVASGRITKIMITKQSNLATMLKSGGVTSNVSGKMGGGAGESSRFGINLAGGLGITGGNNGGYQTDYGPDINKVRQMNENIMRGDLGAAANAAVSQGGILNKRAMSGSGAAFLSGPGVAAATMPGTGGTRNMPGRNVGAGGGWSKSSSGGATVLNLSMIINSKADLEKALKDLITKTYPGS